MNDTRPGAMRGITEACADDAEVLALSALRMIAAGYSTGDVACWDMAYTGVERVLRPEAAGRLVASLTTLFRAVRAERPAEWRFMPATCCRVTTDEEGIIRLLAAARRGTAPHVARAGAEVTGASASPHLRDAAGAAGRVLDEVAGELAARGAPHRQASARLH